MMDKNIFVKKMSLTVSLKVILVCGIDWGLTDQQSDTKINIIKLNVVCYVMVEQNVIQCWMKRND